MFSATRSWWGMWSPRAGCDHETVEIEILGAMRRVRNKMNMLDFRRAEVGLLEDLLGRIPWDRALSVED